MASMVAKACSSTSTQMPVLTVQEKGSRNKRKFRADPPLANLDKIIPLPQNECPSFDISTDQFESLSSHDHTNGCDMCCSNQDSDNGLKLNLGLPSGTSKVGPSRPREELEASSCEFHDADWSDLTESQLQELLLANLDTIFKNAIKKIVDSGYTEEVANRAILRAGLWYGCNDMVSNIVDNTLAFLNSGHEIDSLGEHYFEDLNQMERYILAELVCLLREVRPFFSTGDAMWCLLISDMNVSHACAMDSDSLGSFLCSDASNRNSTISGQPQFGTAHGNSDPNTMLPCLPNTSVVTYARRSPSDISKTASIFGGHNFQAQGHMNSEASTTFSGLTQEKEDANPASNISEKPFNATGKSHSNAEEKLVGNRKVTKRDYILRQKSHFEKYHRTHGSKGTSTSGKLSNFGGLVLDKKLKAVADSTGLNTKNPPTEIDKAVSDSSGVNGFSSVPATGQESANGNLLSEQKISSLSQLTPVNFAPSLSVADTELSLSFPSKTNIANPMPISFNTGSANFSSGSIIPSNEKSQGTSAPHDRKDEIIMKLAPRVRELQNQLQEWTEWANQKVMQAARRLSKEKAELKTLRQEKEEVERLKKEQQTSEESNLKKLSEIENALRKASGQVQRASAAVRRREIENASLRRELEAARLHAAESAMSCEEVTKREKTMLVNLQSCEKQKMTLQDELAAERRKSMLLQQTVQQARDARDQAEGKLNQEEKANNEILTQVNTVKKERQRIEASSKSKEDSIKLRAESNLQKYKDDIMKLEKEISQLRLKKDSSKIAALKRGIDGSYASKVQNSKTAVASKDYSTMSYISKMTDLSLDEGVKRDRECVMCLSEEMSVVFLPCAHQVVCTTCNELHEKQGMKDCPSCRTLIRQRVPVRYSRS